MQINSARWGVKLLPHSWRHETEWKWLAIKRASPEVIRSHHKVGFANTMLMFVSCCSDEWFYGLEWGRERKKVPVVLKIVSHRLLLCSGQAVQQHKLQLNIIKLYVSWAGSQRQDRGARQSSQTNVAVCWDSTDWVGFQSNSKLHQNNSRFNDVGTEKWQVLYWESNSSI